MLISNFIKIHAYIIDKHTVLWMIDFSMINVLMHTFTVLFLILKCPQHLLLNKELFLATTHLLSIWPELLLTYSIIAVVNSFISNMYLLISKLTKRPTHNLIFITIKSYISDHIHVFIKCHRSFSNAEYHLKSESRNAFFGWRAFTKAP